MDPLSDVLSLLKPRSYISGGFEVGGDLAIQFPKHQGIKCYAVLAGQCWLSVEGVPDPVLLTAGDCFLLPRGLPFRLATDLSLTPVDFHTLLSAQKAAGAVSRSEGEGRYIVGGHFLLSGSHADMLLGALPPIVHIRKESDKAAMRWSLERMREELRNPQPGGSLIAQQLAYMMLIQALRLHLADEAKGASVGSSPWPINRCAWRSPVCTTIQGIVGHCRNSPDASVCRDRSSLSGSKRRLGRRRWST